MRGKGMSTNLLSLSFRDICYSCECYTNLEGVYKNVIVALGISEELTYTCHGLTFISKAVNVEGFVVIVFLILTLIKS